MTAYHRHQVQIAAELVIELIELQQLDTCKGNHNQQLQLPVVATVVIVIEHPKLLPK